MIRAAVRFFRKAFPRLLHPILDAELIQLDRDAAFAAAYRDVVRIESADQNCEDPFVTERYIEGQRWRGVLNRFAPDHDDRYILDVGGGNGAIELALTAEERWHVISVDSGWNDTVRMLQGATETVLRRVIADASHLPFRPNTFDAVTCLETVEHFSDARSAASEIMKVTKPRGLLLLTTPPRWRFALRPDPHFGIRCLVLFPPFLQRAIVARRGFRQPHHFVDRIYSSTKQLQRLFAGYDCLAVLSRSRAPQRWFWDALVFQRRPEPRP
jgi:SAM-dependent methyltransferase